MVTIVPTPNGHLLHSSELNRYALLANLMTLDDAMRSIEATSVSVDPSLVAADDLLAMAVEHYEAAIADALSAITVVPDRQDNDEALVLLALRRVRLALEAGESLEQLLEPLPRLCAA